MIFLRRSNSLSISSLKEPKFAPATGAPPGAVGAGDGAGLAPGGPTGPGGPGVFIFGGCFMNEGVFTDPPPGAVGGPDGFPPAGGNLGGGGKPFPPGAFGGPEDGGPAFFGGPLDGGPGFFGGPEGGPAFFGGPLDGGPLDGGPLDGGPLDGGPGFLDGPADAVAGILPAAGAESPGPFESILNNSDAAFSLASSPDLIPTTGLAATFGSSVTTVPFPSLIPLRSF